MGARTLDREQVLAAVRQSKQAKVKLAITDIDGVLRGKYVSRDKFLSAAEGGFGFCDVVFGWDSADVCYDNVKFTGWHTGYPDAQARIDLNSFRTVPWDNDVPFFLADFIEGETPNAVCPRQLLKTTIKRLDAAGFRAMAGLEFEWFNFAETPKSLAEGAIHAPQPLTPGMFGYSLLRAGQNREYFNAIMDEMLAFDVPIEGLHTETGPGVYEAAMSVADPLEAADRAVLFKSGCKEIASRYGVMASFMAKWNTKLPGCSGHIHQSLQNHDGSAAFFDASDPHRMSDTFRHFLAGQMACLPEILPMFAPTINSYKRLTEGMWAPTRVVWSVDNRTAAFRVLPGSEKSTRLETRVGGSDLNPYLATAAALASGLYGIENKLELPSEPCQGSAYEAKDAPRLPTNLQDAANAMRQSEIAKTLFGEAFVDHFTNTRLWEWRQFQAAVTDWEMKRYFEII